MIETNKKKKNGSKIDFSTSKNISTKRIDWKIIIVWYDCKE